MIKLKFKKLSKTTFLTILLLFLCGAIANGQQLKVKGNIVGPDGQSIPGVTVLDQSNPAKGLLVILMVILLLMCLLMEY